MKTTTMLVIVIIVTVRRMGMKTTMFTKTVAIDYKSKAPNGELVDCTVATSCL